jgi:signal transduction histidine kinase
LRRRGGGEEHDAQVAAFAQIVDVAAARVARMHDLSRKQLEGNLALVDLRRAIAEAIALAQTQFEQHSVVEGRHFRIVSDIPDLPPVRADEAQLRAAFLNLIRNSREAMPRGGRLLVATRETGAAGVEAEVRDTGGGIPAEALPRIFDPFYSTKEKGTGLGLAFTQQVVQEHGGSVRCMSAPGQGTIFSVRLPRAPEERAAVGAAMGEAASA